MPIRPMAIHTNRLPRGIGIERLRDPPTEWSRQFEALGLNPE
jgi:site-specific DNA recombinase